MGAHSAFGRNAGLTREQIRDLRRLEFGKCGPREFIALDWVHSLLTCPGGVPEEVGEAFVNTFSPEERAWIKASMKSMFCVNLLMSTLTQGRLGSRLVGMLPGAPAAGREMRPGDFPEDLLYHPGHMWARRGGKDGKDVTVGITFYAQDQLGDIVFLEAREAGSPVKAGEAMGEVESNKSVSELIAPVSGTVLEVNREALEAPEIINRDPYGAGWIARIEPAGAGALNGLLKAADYLGLIRGG